MKTEREPPGASPENTAFMREALALAKSNLGKVWPNPSVGCVIVKDDEVVGRGVTGAGGQPHAEAAALDEAADRARKSTVFVSLEPCCHWGVSPPCTESLIAAGVDTVVVAHLDPDERVNGKGVEELRSAGIAVTLDVCKEEAEEVNAGFFHRVATGRPLVCELEEDHLGFDAILLDLATWLSISPTARRERLCIVVDDTNIAPTELANISGEARKNIWLAAANDRAPSRLEMLSSMVGRLLPVESEKSGAVKIDAMLQDLGALGLTRVGVDANGKLAARLRAAALI